MLRLRYILLPIIVLLSLVPSAFAQEDLLSRLDKATGVKLPDGYGEKVAGFVKTNALMQTIIQSKDALAFTEQFIIEKMKEDWGINRQNQLLFVWEAISFVADEEIYDGEDGNEARLEDFEAALDNLEGCEKAYYDGLKARMEEISAEARQQSAEAQQQSAEAKRSKITENIATIEGYLQDIRHGLSELEKMKEDGKYALEDTEQSLVEFSNTEKDILAKCNPLKKKVQGGIKDTDLDECLPLSNQLVSATARLVSAISKRRSAEAKQRSAEYKQQSAEYVKRIRQSSYSTLCEVVAIYKTHVEKPHLARPEEIKEVKEITAETIATCKEYDIDYKSILLDELGGDKEKLKAFLKFFGIE